MKYIKNYKKKLEISYIYNNKDLTLMKQKERMQLLAIYYSH